MREVDAGIWSSLVLSTHKEKGLLSSLEKVMKMIPREQMGCVG
jgi:hypothetical protein